ncbi:MAG: menaquinone biosynthesis protein [Deltaproteobacteria bacterium]|jgi:chorismate dehydratase|nr:menaquinone biosynthesis protein [Deltaproteobacteria bacterium]
MLKLGVIDVLNVLPVYYGILKQKINIPAQLILGKVTELNNKLNTGDIDISVVSSFEYAKNYHQYYILPKLSVSADGPVGSIYLFLDKPIDQLSRDKIKLTAFSFTSVHLIQFLLNDYNITYVTDETDESVGEVLIADEAIKRFYQRKDAYVYDLSELWKQKTGLPFVFALWCVRREVYHQYQQDVLQVYDALLTSKKTSEMHFTQMAREYFTGIFPDQQSCEFYLRNLHYNFTPKYQDGFNLFQKEMLKIAKLQEIAPLEFIDQER